MTRLLLFLFLLSSITLIAQDSTLERSFDQQHLEEYLGDSKYQYEKQKTIPPKKPNAFLSFLGDSLQSLFRFLTSKAGVITLVIVLVGIILFAFRKSIFKKKAKEKTETDIPAYIPKGEELSIEQLYTEIDAHEKAGNYKEAIRKVYLLVILSLADRNLIKIHRDKTNSEYRKELPRGIQKKFKYLTTIFEYVWYGDYDANAMLLDQAKRYANSLNQVENVA